MEETVYEGIIECILFACGQPLEKEKISMRLEIDLDKLASIIKSMNEKYSRANRGIFIREIGEGYQLCTKAEYHEYIDIFAQKERRPALSQAAYETLAIIAVNGPATRGLVERIRGVNSDGIFIKLTEYGFIEEKGRMDVPGNPYLYDITERFYRNFGISNRNELIKLFEDIKGE